MRSTTFFSLKNALLFLLLTSSFQLFPQSACEEKGKKVEELINSGQFKLAYNTARECLELCKKDFSEESAQYADASINLSLLLFKMGQLKEALEYCSQGGEIYKKLNLENTEAYGAYLNSLSAIYKGMGDYPKAMSAINEALENIEKIRGDQNAVYGLRLNTKGALMLDTGQYPEAVEVLLEAEKRVKSKGENTGDYIAVLANLSQAYEKTGNYERATVHLESAVEKSEIVLGKGNPDYITIKSNLASLYHTSGKYEKALTLHEELSLISKDALGENHFQNGIILMNYGQLLHELGQIDKALEVTRQGGEIIKKALGDDHYYYYLCLGNLGQIHAYRGNHKERYDKIKKSMDLVGLKMGTTHPEYLRNQYNLSQFYDAFGLTEKSSELLFDAEQKYRTSVGTDNPGYATILSSIADLYAQQKDTVRAIEYFNKSLDIVSKVHGKDHMDYGLRLVSLANFHFETGNYSTALHTNKQGIAIIKNSLGPDTIQYNYGYSLFRYALHHWKAGNIQAATELFERSRTILNASFKSESYHETLGQLNSQFALFEEQNGNLPNSLELFKTANSIYDNQVSNNLNILTDEGKEQFIKKIRTDYARFWSFALRNHTLFPALPRMVYNDHLNLNLLLLDNSKELFSTLRNSEDSLIKADFKKWLNLKQLLFFQTNLSVADRKVKQLKSIRDQVQAIEERLIQESYIFRQARAPVAWKNVKSSLNDSTAAVEFIHFKELEQENEQTIYCALITRNNYDEPKLIRLFEEKRLRKELSKPTNNDEEYIQWVYRGEKIKKENTNFSKLYDIIWRPVDSLLKDIKTVYYSPTGLLHRVSFPAIAEDLNNSLIDKYELHYVNSTRQLVTNHPAVRPKNVKNAVIYGGLIYKTDSLQMSNFKFMQDSSLIEFRFDTLSYTTLRMNPLPYLPGSLRELKKTALQLKSNQVFTMTMRGYEALEENFKMLGKIQASPDIIHISTHGFFREKCNLNPFHCSGLYMAGVDSVLTGNKPLNGFEDGILYAYEVANMDLSQTKLVVLSACETGLGEIRGGEGVYGLQRAFKIAGVENIIMSLWSIRDDKTSEFMETFYQKWFDGKTNNIQKAFSETQKLMRSKYPNPYFWGAFVLI